MASRTNVVKSYFSDNLKTKLQAICEEKGMTESEYIRDAVTAKIRRDTRQTK